MKAIAWINPFHRQHPYAVAALAAILTVLLRLCVNPLLGHRAVFLGLTLAVMFSAWYGGLRPGLLCMVIGSTVSAYLWFDPRYTQQEIHYSDYTQLGLFLLIGTGISLLVRKIHQAQAQTVAETAALRESQKQLQATFEQAAVGLAHVGLDGRWRKINQKLCDITGYSREQLLTRTFQEITYPDNLDKDLDNIQQLLAGEINSYAMEKRYIRCDKSLVWVNLTVALVRNEAGQPDYFISVIEDIEQRKQAEAAQATLAAIIESSSEAIIGETLDGQISSWNAGAERLFGYKAEEILGRPVSILAPPDQQNEIPENLQQAHRGQRVQHMEARRIRKDGQQIEIWLSVSPIRDLSGRIIGVAKIAHDISDIKRVHAELKAARDTAEVAKVKAEEASKAKDHFLAVLSHELRTPLTPVLAAVELLQSSTPADSDTAENLDMIRRNVEMEARLIDDLLDITRIARGKVELDKRPVDLGTILHRATEVCRGDVEARRQHFGVDMGPGSSYWIEADAVRMQQVFWNLLKNAIKFTPPGGCVGIRCRPDGQGHVVVEVNDSGAGIEPEALQRIFNAFEQAERSITRQFGGLGLGLAISKALVEMHGGTISAHSEGKGKGATFRVKLPMLSASADRTSSAALQKSAAALQPSDQGKPLRILLVEDHGDTAKIMRRLLTTEGHQVVTASDVAAALESVSQNQFDLLISDLGLPDSSGLDLIRTLREQGSSLPAIALSGYGREDDVRQSLDAGFNAHLTKPVDFRRLKTAIRAGANAR